MTRTTAEIRRAANELLERRKLQDESLHKLIVALISFCRQSHGKATEVAQSLDISRQYLSDVQNGKRGISDQLAEKLAELK